MKELIKNILFISIILCYGRANTVLGQTLKISEVLTKIEENNSALLSYQNKILAANELVNGAGAWMPTKVSTEWDMIPYSLDYKMSQLRLAVMQDIPSYKKIKAKENYLSSIANIEKNQGGVKKNEFFTLAKDAYNKRYIAEKRISILTESINIMKTMIVLAEKQMAIAKGDLATVYRLKARLTQNESMLVHEQNMVRAETTILNYLMNVDINQTFEIDTAGLLKNYRMLNANMKMDSLDCKRSDLMRMTSEINSMKLNQTLVSLNKRPTYQIQLTNFTRFGGRPDMFAIMGSVFLPIVPWASKGYKSEVKSMSYSIKAMEQTKQNMLSMAQQMIKMSLIELESEYKELDNYKNLVIPAYKKSLDANLLAYSQNTNDLSMTLMALDDLQMAHMEYLKHLDTYLKIQAEYEKEMQIR